MTDEKISQAYVQKLLDCLRKVVAKRGYDTNRLPRWVDSADVRMTRLHNTYLFYIKPGDGKQDSFEFLKGFNSDSEFLFGLENVRSASGLPLPGDPEDFNDGESKPVKFKSSADSNGKFAMASNDCSLFNTTDGQYHFPLTVLTTYFSFQNDGQIVSTTYIPISLYVHLKDISNPENNIKAVCEGLSEYLQDIHGSEMGDYYESQKRQKAHAYESRIENSVIVLGAFDDGSREAELERIRDHLKSEGYDANLIKDLPGHPARSALHKAKTYAMTSRFCVIVDIEASGHIGEYRELRGEDVPIALLRKEGHASTSMIGHEHMTDDYIKLFEFEHEPLEIIDDVIEWEKEFNKQREADYSEYFRWRD